MGGKIACPLVLCAAATGWKKLQNALVNKKMGDNLVPAGHGGNVKLHESPDSIPSSPSQHHKDFFSKSEAGKKELADRLKNEAEGTYYSDYFHPVWDVEYGWERALKGDGEYSSE
ncbi:hypothetical protein BBD42_27180 [Paenibacillus sp. BIHB 4019]|uniref:Uncharacterized protein n=1 Tax=Paenibacillus sp. BIHB 4019 TaxID=1870819 RepID=A0A1B2DPX8_9BACL|nr:hypothetical protein [Paenibacillus sp. BIHB 4019]ANY69765.1 hypothetical protein BBD42_27180 [Paenibacillus sp. BIHB 4019]